MAIFITEHGGPNWPQILGAVAVVFVVKILFYDDASIGGRTSSSQRSTPSSFVSSVSVEADALRAAYDENELAADRDYKRARLLISGTIQSVGKDIADTPYVTLGSGLVPAVQAMFSKADESRLISLAKGQRISVECDGDGKLGWVFAKNCRIP